MCFRYGNCVLCNCGRDERGLQQNNVKNKIIKSSVKETWEDVIDYVIANREISDELEAPSTRENLKCVFRRFRDVSATLRFGHSLYLISMDEETECRSLYFSMDY